MTITKDQALEAVIQAAESWHNELGEYIIPASEEAKDGADYQEGYNTLTEALEVLNPTGRVGSKKMWTTHKECGSVLITMNMADGEQRHNQCPICEHEVPEADRLEREDLVEPAEFTQKKTELACFLYELYYGKGEWLRVLLEPTYSDTYDNYMADASDILRANTHLLTLKTAQAMGLTS